MKNLNLPDCPYCRSEAGYLDSFFAKNKESHKCACCGRVSRVGINSGIFGFFIVTQIISIIAFIFSVIMGGRYCLFGIGVITLCSLIFYGLSPYMVRFSRWRLRDIENQNDEIKTNENYSGSDSEKEIYSN